MTDAIIPDHYQLIGDGWIEWHSTLSSALESTALIEAFCLAEVCPSDCIWRDITEDAALIWAATVNLADVYLPVMFQEHLAEAQSSAVEYEDNRADPNAEHSTYYKRRRAMTDSSSQSYCTQCKYFKRTFLMPNNLGKCFRPQTLDPVDGSYKASFASVERDFDHLCGAEGKYFTPKEPSLISKFITAWKRRQAL